MLGHVEVVVKGPHDAIRQMPRHGMGASPTPLWFAPETGVTPGVGTYEARWYGTTPRRKRYEIARSRFTARESVAHAVKQASTNLAGALE
jgi:hypothetical protein